MYNMYPNYSELLSERGTGGLGHYDYPIYDKPKPAEPATEAAEVQRPAVPTPEAERAVGYISVNEMVTD